jgi:hypothetical protein
MHKAARISSGKNLGFRMRLDRKGQVARIAKLHPATAESGSNIISVGSLKVNQVVRREPTVIICKNDYFPRCPSKRQISRMTETRLLRKKYFTAQ